MILMINYDDNEDILNNDNDKSSNNDNDSDDYINDNWFIFVSFQVFDKSHLVFKEQRCLISESPQR